MTRHRIIGDDPKTLPRQCRDNAVTERNPDWPAPLSAWDWIVGAVVWGVAMVALWGMVT